MKTRPTAPVFSRLTVDDKTGYRSPSWSREGMGSSALSMIQDSVGYTARAGRSLR